jgi:TRAP-type uncharacterized transport system substrate-binding protein
MESCKPKSGSLQHDEKPSVALPSPETGREDRMRAMLAVTLVSMLCVLQDVEAQTAAVPLQPRASRQPKAAELPAREKLNAWTVGLAGGLLEGAPIRFATDIARVVDDHDNLHVLPIVTRGPAENVEALLFLKGVDVAIINADALEQFRSLVPNIQNRITYILSLFPSELHIFARPEIKSVEDLKGKKVNFNTPGTAAAYSGPLIFDRMKIDVEKTFIPHQVALENMKSGQGDIAAVVFVTSKPIEALARSRWEGGFKLLPVDQDLDFYLPATLNWSDYPQLLREGEVVRTIAVPTVLAAFNWPRNSDRYKRVARLTRYLFDRVETLHGPGYHPKWKEINVAARVPGLDRFPAAQEWLDQNAARARETAGPDEAALARDITRRASPESEAERDRLYREFMEWRRQRR